MPVYIRISDVIPAGQTIKFKPKGSLASIKFDGACIAQGFEAVVQPNGRVLAEDRDKPEGFTRLTADLLGYSPKTKLQYGIAQASEYWEYEGIPVSELYSEMFTDLLQEVYA